MKRLILFCVLGLLALTSLEAQKNYRVRYMYQQNMTMDIYPDSIAINHFLAIHHKYGVGLNPQTGEIDGSLRAEFFSQIMEGIFASDSFYNYFQL